MMQQTLACNRVGVALLCITDRSKSCERSRKCTAELSDVPWGHNKRTVNVSTPSHLPRATQQAPHQILPLMKFDIPMMTAAMTAMNKDTVEREENVNSL